MADVGGCSLAFVEATPVVSLAFPVVTGPDPASRPVVLQGPANATAGLTAGRMANITDFANMTFLLLTSPAGAWRCRAPPSCGAALQAIPKGSRSRPRTAPCS